MEKPLRRFYVVSLGILAALSIYPVVMGLKIIVIQLLNGSIRPEDYARYVIPYTAICLSILICVALFPLILRLKRSSTLAATVLGLGLFVGLELLMESITIKSAAVQTAVKWQLFSCVYTPAAKLAYLADYTDAYKIHYFLVSFVIIALVISIVYGYGRMIASGDRAAKVPLRMQLVAAILLLGLCVFANFTGFFREKTDYLPPLSAFLTGTFFVVLGVASGIYIGSCLIGRSRFLSVILPGISAVLVCSVMYYGEYQLLGGTLYRLGHSLLFQALPVIVVSPVDIGIILLSGILTVLLMNAVEKRLIN